MVVEYKNRYDGAVPQISSNDYWRVRAQAGYASLGWVNATGILDKIVHLAQLQGNELVVDAGTGTGAVLDVVARVLNKGGTVIGFDISEDMVLSRPTPRSQNSVLMISDVNDIPLPSNTVDVVTARHLFHNLSDVPRSISEIYRILRPGGRAIICEYVPIDEVVWNFEKPIWDIKEPGRNLWTGSELARDIAQSWPNANEHNIELYFEVMTQYSNRDWMSKSGLPKEVQEAILNTYLEAPPNIVERMGMTITSYRDTLIDRLFAYVVAIK